MRVLQRLKPTRRRALVAPGTFRLLLPFLLLLLLMVVLAIFPLLL